MAGPAPNGRIARFGAFEVDLSAGEVRRNGLKQRLSGQPFQVLTILLASAGDVVGRDALRKRLWDGDTFVDFDHSLGVAINTIREALGDSAESPRFIETVRGRGYRFIAPVRWEDGNVAALSERRMAISTSPVGAETPPLHLDGQRPSLQPGGERPPLRPPAWRLTAPWAIAAISLAALIVVAVRFRRPAPSRAGAIVSQIPPPPNYAFQFGPAYAVAPTLSPDGRRVAFLADSPQGKPILWVRSLDSNEARPLDGTENAATPFWSPDSAYIAFFAYGKLKKVRVSGGPPTNVCEAPNGRGGTWSPDGTILFAPSSESTTYRVSADGGKPTPVTTLGQLPAEGNHRWPQFLPDHRHFLFYAASNSAGVSGGTYVGSLDGRKPRLVLRGDSNAIYAPPGYLLFAQDGALMAQRFDAVRLELSGNPIPVANSVRILPTAWRTMASASQNGILAYTAGTAAAGWQLEWFDRNGKAEGSIAGTHFFKEPNLSPDGEKLGVVIGAMPIMQGNIWVFDLATAALERVTFTASQAYGPIWSPDGTRIVFSSNRTGAYELYEKAANGTGGVRSLTQDNSLQGAPDSWSSDGRYIAYNRPDPQGKTGADIWILPLFGDKKPFPFLNSEANEGGASFSPDGKWLAYVSDESGRNEVYIVPFPKRNGRWQVSTEGGRAPRWRRDGKELFYLSRANKLMAVKIREINTTLAIGSPQALFQTHPPPSLWPGRTFDVTPDGKRFIVVTRLATPAGAEPVTLLVNWTALLNTHR